MLAHRGLAADAPENTLLAFAAALAAGASYIETDVHASADGVAIISHDPDLKRMAGRDVAIAQLTAAELSRVDLGSGQGYPTLVEALDALPDARFNIDVKSRAAAGPTAAAILAANAARRVLVTSFDDGTRRAALAALGGAHMVATAASRRGVVWALVGARLGVHPLVRTALSGVGAVQVPARVGPVRVVTPRFVDAVRRAGVEVHVWVVNDEDEIRRLIVQGADGIVTDRADVAVAVVRDLAGS